MSDDPQIQTFAHRSRMLAAMPDLLKSARNRKKTGSVAGSTMLDMFGGGQPIERRSVDLPDVPCLPVAELLQGEMESLGYYISTSPIEKWTPIIRAFASHDAGNVGDGGGDRGESRSPMILGGIVGNLKLKAKKTAKGSKSDANRMARFTLEDGSGTVAAMAWPDVYQDHADLISNGSAVFVSAVPGDRSESREVVVSRAIPARRAAPMFLKGIGIVIGDGEKDDDGIAWPDYDGLIEFGMAHPGAVPLWTCQEGGRPVRAWHDGKDLGVKLSAAMINEAEERFGATHVHLMGCRGSVNREYLMTVEL